jgi:hypothetical protein
MRSWRLDQGICRGMDTGPVTECVARSTRAGSSLAVTIRDDVEAIAAQADHEGDDGPAQADRRWW